MSSPTSWYVVVFSSCPGLAAASLGLCVTLVCLEGVQDCQYFHETDTLGVRLVTAVPGLIDNTEDAVPGLLVDYTATNQIVGFDVRRASSRTRARISDGTTDVQGVSSLSLQSQYCQEANTLTVSLVQNPPHCKPVCTDDSRITILGRSCWKMGKRGHLTC